MNDAEVKRSQTPFIIWTMQRTGGTNFTRNLIDLSKLSAQHEPFNRPRIYGSISRTWEQDKDIKAVRAAIADALEKPQVIKHCVEMVPWRISAELAQVSAEKGYRSLFLIRESSLHRLLSMEYAQRTKVWGPSHEKPDELTDNAFDEDLNVQELFNHEKKGIDRLNQFWGRLKLYGVTPVQISFETLYEAPVDYTHSVVSNVLKYLELEKDVDIAALIGALRNRGNQQTRDRYSRFRGVEDLKEQISQLPAYNFT